MGVRGWGRVCTGGGRGVKHLKVDLLQIDIFLDISLQNLEEKAAVCVKAVLPHRVQQIVPHLRGYLVRTPGQMLDILLERRRWLIAEDP